MGPRGSKDQEGILIFDTIQETMRCPISNMGRPKKPPPSLVLFPISRERAWELVMEVPRGARIERRYKRCYGKSLRACHQCSAPDYKGHGPYWCAIYRRRQGLGSLEQVRYLTEERRMEVLAAWEMLREELDAADQAELDAQRARLQAEEAVQRALPADIRAYRERHSLGLSQARRLARGTMPPAPQAKAAGTK